jgi:hypothetical protein
MGAIGTIAKGAAAIGGRVGAGLLGGPVGTAIGIASSLPLLIDLVRSFMDGGEHNADPKAIAAQRDKVVAELTRNGKSPAQARAEVDELLRPMVEETASSRDSEPTGIGEGLVDVALAAGGILGGRKYGKREAHLRDRKAKRDGPHDSTKDLGDGDFGPQPMHGPEPMHGPDAAPPRERQREFVGTRGEERRLEQERGLRGEMDSVSRQDRALSVPERGRGYGTDFDEPGGDMPRRARGRVVDDEGAHIPEVFDPISVPMSDDEFEMRAAMSRLRGEASRRPPGAYRAPPERLGVSDDTMAAIGRRGRPQAMSPEELEALRMRDRRSPSMGMGGWGGEGY